MIKQSVHSWTSLCLSGPAEEPYAHRIDREGSDGVGPRAVEVWEATRRGGSELDASAEHRPPVKNALDRRDHVRRIRLGELGPNRAYRLAGVIVRCRASLAPLPEASPSAAVTRPARSSTYKRCSGSATPRSSNPTPSLASASYGSRFVLECAAIKSSPNAVATRRVTAASDAVYNVSWNLR
jgi:hypothetical protein